MTSPGDIPDPADPGPLARARASWDSPGPHERRRKLRKGREQCTAHRRDGEQCLAPAVEGALVCLRHGGSAPQVRIAARHMVLLEVNYFAHLDRQEARGTNRGFDALCKALQAQRELDAYEGRMTYLAYLKAELKRLAAGQGGAGSQGQDVPVS